jgi:hypothetical protein
MQSWKATAMTLRTLDMVTSAALPGALAGLSAVALWTGILISEWPRLTAVGVICGESTGYSGHCPACYVAAALTLVAIGCEAVRLSAAKGAGSIVRR